MFVGSYSWGLIFCNGNCYIMFVLVEKLDVIFDDFFGFYYGWFDVKFSYIDVFMCGDVFIIFEVNGVSSEVMYIWDCEMWFGEIFIMLFK